MSFAHEPQAFLTGHADIEAGAHGGVVPHRLPADARMRHDQLDLRWAEACTAGVALRARTDASRLGLRLLATAVCICDEGAVTPRIALRDGPNVSVVTLEHCARHHVSASREVRYEDAEPIDVTFTRPGVAAELEVLLPHDASVELLELWTDAPAAPIPDRVPRWIHHGSSISHCVNAPSPDRTWPAQVAAATGWRLRNLAFSGNAQLDQFVARTIRDAPAELITLKLGINVVNGDTMRQRTFLPAVHGFLDTIRDGHPHTPIVVISAISCPAQEDVPGPVVRENGRFRPAHRSVEADDGALTLGATRTVLEGLVEQRRTADQQLFYVDGRALFGAADVHLLDDDLHPDQRGTDLIAARFVGALPQVCLPSVAAEAVAS